MASGPVAVQLATIMAALGGHLEGICLLLEREEDFEPGWNTLLCRWLGERVVLASHSSLESGMRAAAAELGPRRPLLLFPEGQRGTAGRGAGAFKSGVGLLALELDVPIVPLNISESAGATRIEVGAAIDPDDYAPQRTQLTSYEVYREIAADVRVRLRDLAQTRD